jgi:cell division transport system permease protein
VAPDRDSSRRTRPRRWRTLGHLGRGVGNVFRGGWPSLLAITVIGVALLVFGLVLVLVINVQGALRGGTVYSLHVFLKDGATDMQRQDLQRVLAGLPGNPRVTWVSKDQAWRKFVALFADRPGMIAGLDHDFLPASFVVRFPRAWAGAQSLESIVAHLSSRPGVEEVATGRPWAEKWIATLRALKPLGFVLTVILLMGVTIIVAGTVRLNLHRRAAEMSILSLVGADRSFIRGPLLIEGALQGGLGALLAVGGLYLIHLVLRQTLSPALFLGLGSWSWLSPWNLATMGLAGVGSGLAGSLAAVAGWRES